MTAAESGEAGRGAALEDNSVGQEVGKTNPHPHYPGGFALSAAAVTEDLFGLLIQRRRSSHQSADFNQSLVAVRCGVTAGV